MTKRISAGNSLDGWMRDIWAQARLGRGLAHAAGALSALAPALAFANPTGGQVVAGSATIGSAGSNGVVVNESSQRAVINWQQFSIGSNQYVQFIQPDSSAVVLNRVTGSNPSSIFGEIKANGQVFLINPNGILFAPGSTLDVSSLTASTLDISNSDFMAGRYVFSRDPGAGAATVINQGNVTVTAGGYVVLAGDYVENDGTIQATTGRVVLAAGGGATLTLDGNGGLIGFQIDAPTLARLAGVDNAGSITALGGEVLMTADVANALTATAVNNSGLITAHSVSQQGGEIELLAKGGDIENSGTLDASAAENGVTGGTVILHGDGKLQLASTSDIEAGGQSNKGGFIDLSGHELNLKGVINPGKRGNLLLDPSTITIESSGTANAANCSGCEGGVIHTNFIEHELNAGIDLTIVASDQIILGVGNRGATTLPTAITATGGTGKLSLKIGTTNFNSLGGGSLHRITSSIFNNQSSLDNTFVPTTGGTINISGLTVHIAGDFVASASRGTVKLGNVTAKTVSVTGAFIKTGNLTATGTPTNAISINAVGSAGYGSVALGKLTATNGGVHIVQSGGSTGISVGSITARRGVVVDDGTGSTPLNVTVNGNVTGSHVTLEAQGGNVDVTGAVKASSGSVFISAQGPTGHSGGNITVGGAITAKGSLGRVKLLANGGGSAGGSGGGNITVGGAINAAGSVTISASYLASGHSFKVQTGNITAGNSNAHSGGIHITMSGRDAVLKTGALLAQGPLHPCSSGNEACHARTGDIILSITGGGSDTASIKITSAKSSHGNISASPGYGGKFTATGSVDAVQGNVNVNASMISMKNITAGGSVSLTGVTIPPTTPTITTGNITAGKKVIVEIQGGASYGGSINLGDVQAGSSISLSVVNTNNSAAAIVKAGNLSVTKPDHEIRIAASGSRGLVSVGKMSAASIDINARGAVLGAKLITGAITAVSNAHPAIVNLTAEASSGSAVVQVNGGITVNGKGPTGHVGSLSNGVTVAAELNVSAIAVNTSQPTSIKITGGINVTGHAAKFSYDSGCECGGVSGSAGAAVVNLRANEDHGKISTGSINLTGPDAFLDVASITIKTGNISVTGSGHSISRDHSHSGNHFTSTNTAGVAAIFLDDGYGGFATNITTGNITVSGKGEAIAALSGSVVVAGNVTMTATAATYKRTHGSVDTSSTFRGAFGLPLDNGKLTGGKAVLEIGQGANSNSSQINPVKSITLGNVSLTGAGNANLELSATTITTKNLSVVATKAVSVGSGSTVSGAEDSLHRVVTYNIDDGRAIIQITNGSAGAGLTDVNGNITATGPVAGVSIAGHAVKVSGNISITGQGGSLSDNIVLTSAGGGSHIHYVGAGRITGLSIGGGATSTESVTVGGIVSVKGPGLVAIHVTADKVTLGGISASASTTAKYSVLNTNVSNTTDNFTLGSAVVIVDEVSNGKVIGPATITGNVVVNAPHGNVYLPTELDIGGQLKVSASGLITADASALLPRFSELSAALNASHGGGGSGSSPRGLSSVLKLKAAGVSMVAGGSIDLTGATVTTPGVMALKAGGDIILSGVTLNTGTLAADAGSTIHNGGAIGTITTKALALVAGKNINLSSTQISVGSGVVTPVASNAALTAMFTDPAFAAAVTGDATLLGGLAAAGISPAAPAPNAVFQAGNTVTLGTLSLTGSYLYLQAGSISLLGPVTLPKGAVVQLAPNGVTGSVDAEGTGAAGATLNLDDNGLFNVFPDGITLVLGGAGQSGAVTLGNNGTFNIGSDNLIVDTSGTVTGLGNVISTGQVVSLDSLVSGVPPVTAGEIDPTANTTTPNTDKDKGQGDTANDVGADTGGTITQDTGTSSVCH